MTPVDKLFTLKLDDLTKIPCAKEIKKMMSAQRVEKIPIINNEGMIIGNF
jgi:hypothetical protein